MPLRTILAIIGLVALALFFIEHPLIVGALATFAVPVVGGILLVYAGWLALKTIGGMIT